MPVSVEAPTIFSISGITNLNTPPGPYARGSVFSVRVSLWNGGNTSIDWGILELYFNLTGYTSDPVNVNVTTISAFSTRTVDFNITVGGAADVGTLEINAQFNGKTALGGDVNVTNTTSPLTVKVLGPSNLTITAITDQTGLGTYVHDMTFNAKVTLENTGGLNVTVSSLVLYFNGATGYSHPAVSSFVVAGGQTKNITITITIGALATTGSIIIDANASGTEIITLNPINIVSGVNDLTVNVQSKASFSILNITDWTGNGTYVGGETFTIRVYYQNTGGTDAINVDASLNFNGYGDLSPSNPAPITVSASSTNYQEFSITVASGANVATVEIDASASGQEEYSNLSLIHI